MKKIFTIIIIIILIAGGYYFWNQAKARKAAEEAAKNKVEFKGLRVVENNTLLGWLKRKDGVECKLASSQGEEIIIKTKNDKARMEGMPYAFGENSNENDGKAITNGGWVYMWSGFKGTKIQLEAVKAGMSEEQTAKAKDYNWEDQAKSWEDAGYTFTCDYEKFSDDDFNPPEDVTFTDMTDTLIGAQKAVEDLKQATPGGNINMEDIEAEMEKLNN